MKSEKVNGQQQHDTTTELVKSDRKSETIQNGCQPFNELTCNVKSAERVLLERCTIGVKDE